VIAGLPPEQTESVLRSGFRLRPLFGLEKKRSEQGQFHLAHFILRVSDFACRASHDGLGLLDEPVHFPANCDLAEQRMGWIAASLGAGSPSCFGVGHYAPQSAKGIKNNDFDSRIV
jgi:hypothetical protein